MVLAVQVSVVLVFCAFVFLDLCSLSPRLAGSITRKNAIGPTFQVILNTMKRVFIVSYPPLLGVIAIITDGVDVLTQTILASYYASLIPLAMVFFMREKVVAFFCALIVAFDSSGSVFRAAWHAVRHHGEWTSEVGRHLRSGEKGYANLDIRLMLAASWVYLFYGSSMFIINIFAVKFDQYAEIIYQLVGFFNALGTIALAFILDPRLSRIYERQENLGITLNSLFGAHLMNLMVLGPLLILAIALFF